MVQQFMETSLKMRKGQVKIFSAVVPSARPPNIRVVECEQLLLEVGRLEDSKQGTFELVDSGLVRIMGSWLVVDCANSCSVSVTDRLNCLQEEGRKLVVNEMGVLGEAVSVTRHEKFRLFHLYDPTRGEISKAMRNRAVRTHLAIPILNIRDAQQLVWAGLEPAVATQADQPSQLGLKRSLRAVTDSSALDGRYSALSSVVLQARLLLQMIEKKPSISNMAVEKLMQFFTYRYQEVRGRLVEWLVGKEWEQLVSQLCENKMLYGKDTSCVDWRLLLASGVRDKASRMALVHRVMVGTKFLVNLLHFLF